MRVWEYALGLFRGRVSKFTQIGVLFTSLSVLGTQALAGTSSVQIGSEKAEETCSQILRGASVEQDWAGKLVIIDTNVLLINPFALHDFPKARIILPMMVLQEIDKKKQDRVENRVVAQNARHAARLIETLTKGYTPGKPIQLANGATLEIDARNYFRIIPEREKNRTTFLDILDANVPDDRIIATAYNYTQHNLPVVFISQDVSAKNKARALGVQSEEYRPGVSRSRIDEEQYSGRIDVIVSDNFYEFASRKGLIKKEQFVTELKTSDPELAQRLALYPNEFVVFWRAKDWAERQRHIEKGEKTNGVDQLLFWFDAAQNTLSALPKVKDLPFNIKPRNLEQRMLVHALFSGKIRMVLAVGKAGTGKTLLGLMAGKEQTDASKKGQYEDHFNQMILMRPLRSVGGEEPGALPGSVNSKVEPYMRAYMDNLRVLFESDGPSSEWGGEYRSKKRQRMNPDQQFYDLIRSGRLDIQVMAYVRGRSLSNRFLLVDEAQNLPPGDLKTIVTRAAEGTKVVLMGDTGQIDAPFLNVYNNALADLIDRIIRRSDNAFDSGEMQDNQRLHQIAIIRLEQGERSELADFMTELYEKLDSQ